MSNPVVAQLIKSGAVLYQGPVGETPPAITTVAYGTAWGGNWIRLGYTKSPLTVAYESTEVDLEVEEVLAALNRLRIGEKMTLETTLAELTAEYIQAAASEALGITTVAAGAGTMGYEQTGLGGEVDLAQHAWGIEGRYVDSSNNVLPIRMIVWKGTGRLNGNLEFSWKTADYTGIPIQIQALADTTQSVGAQLCRIQRATAPAA